MPADTPEDHARPGYRSGRGTRLAAVVLSLAGNFLSGGAMGDTTPTRPPPSIDETVIMLYYRDLGPATAFYGDALGLETVYESASAKLFRLTSTAIVGIVREGEQAYHPVRDENAVMLSIVTADVDAWYERLRDRDDVEILKPVADSPDNPIRAFLVADPGGYTVEFFSWLKEQP
jgi:catechol 2,3-dioxygenase-like lactoylglutathione lyase family enzyme